MVDPQKAQDLENNINQGVLMPTSEEEQASGQLDLSQFPQVSPDGNNDRFLSDFDPQSNGFDTLACNIFSSIGMTEVNINSMGGDPEYGGAKVELSERFAAVQAGLNGFAGSSEQQWRDEVTSKGLVKQSDWLWTQGLTREQYFAPVNPTIASKGLLFLQKYTPFPRTVGTDKASLQEALKYGAVKIFVGTGPGWNQAEPNVVPVNTGAMNHAVTLRYIDSLGYHIRDQYAPFLKVLHPDYRIFYASQTLYKRNAFHHTFNKDLQYGLTDPECVFLQMALFIDGEFSVAVPYNMHFGQNTLEAVQRFQVKYGIIRPGVQGYGRCGPRTRAKLNQLYS